MAKLTLNDISGGYQTADAYNANNALIEAALENTLSLDGTTPNQMGADLDMNSYSINNIDDLNAGSLIVTSLVLNGTVVTTTTTLAGALTAAEVSYNGGTLQDALDDDYIRDDEDGVIAGDLSVVDLTASGNIIVAGTVDGIDVASRDTTVQAEITALEATIQAAVVSGHTRAGSTQLIDGTSAYTDITISTVVAHQTWESVGPTGSGADNIWATLDNLPANATMLILEVEMQGTSTGADGMGVLFAGGDIVSPQWNNQYSHNLEMSHTFDTSETLKTTNQIMIPLGPTNQDFQILWSSTMTVSSFVYLRYRGFLTD